MNDLPLAMLSPAYFASARLETTRAALLMPLVAGVTAFSAATATIGGVCRDFCTFAVSERADLSTAKVPFAGDGTLFGS